MKQLGVSYSTEEMADGTVLIYLADGETWQMSGYCERTPDGRLSVYHENEYVGECMTFGRAAQMLREKVAA